MKTFAYVLGGGVLVLLASLAFAQNAGPNPAQVADLALANRILSNEGVLDAYGHVSVRDERNPNHFLLARAIAAGTVTAADIIEYDLDSNAVRESQPAGFTERFIHGQIYKARPDVNSVIHFHSPEVIPFGVSGVPLKALIHMAGFLPPVVPIFEIRKVAGITDLLIRSNELGKALSDTLADKPIVLLRGHGAVVVGPALHVAVGRAYYAVANARTQMQTMLLAGDKITYLDPGEAEKSAEQDGFERGWNLWKAKVQK